MGANLPLFETADFRIANDATFIRASFADTISNSYWLTDIYGLQGFASQSLLGAAANLQNDIDARQTTTWNDGAGFKPIGTLASPFTGAVDGWGFKITGLTINSSDPAGAVGLVGVNSGSVQRLNLDGGSVRGLDNVGALVGINKGQVTNVSSSATVQGVTNVGGLIGANHGWVQTAQALGDVSGVTNVGGVAGALLADTINVNPGVVFNAAAGGAVQGTTNVGGLVGFMAQYTSVDAAYAAGRVVGDTFVGGFVGRNEGVVNSAYALGSVTGNTNVGGFAGGTSGPLYGVYASGIVTGNPVSTGGLVGINTTSLEDGNSIQGGYFDSFTTGQSVAIGSGSSTGVFEVTSDPTKSAASNYAYKQSAYTQNGDPANSLRISADSDLASFYMIEGSTRPMGKWELQLSRWNGHQLQLLDWAGRSYSSWTLPNDIDLAPELAAVSVNGSAKYPGLWGSAGFAPIGTTDAPFNGEFLGNGLSIRNLVINRPDSDNVGLFGFVAQNCECAGFSNLKLVGGSITGRNNVGALAGFMRGAVTDVSSTVEVHGADFVGGLVGTLSRGSMSHVTASGDVSGANTVGGLVGYNAGAIQFSSASGKVTGIDGIGGLVGANSFGILPELSGNGTVYTSEATGDVSGVSNVGGLIGINDWWTGYTSASGKVTGSTNIGGLIGMQNAEGHAVFAFATGAVQGTTNVGGLVGANQGNVFQAYASGAVTGATNVGGVIGAQLGSDGVVSAAYFDSYTTGVSVAVGSQDPASIVSTFEVTSDPAQKAAANYAYRQSAYLQANTTYLNAFGGQVVLGNALSFVTGADLQAGTSGWYMINGRTRPFAAWMSDGKIKNASQLQLMSADLAGNYTLAADMRARMRARTSASPRPSARRTSRRRRGRSCRTTCCRRR